MIVQAIAIELYQTYLNGPGVPKIMKNELKSIVKILENNKIQINT